MIRLMLVAALLALPMAAAAQDELSAEESLLAYCHGMWSSTAVTDEQVIKAACASSETTPRCQNTKALILKMRPGIDGTVAALKAELRKHGLIDDRGWVGPRGAAADALSRQGHAQALACFAKTTSFPMPTDPCSRAWWRCHG
jgi:hypothetical protein